jgi:hypothetical protein
LQLVNIKKIAFDRKTWAAIVGISIMLGVNSFNLVLDRIAQILITIEVSMKNSKTSTIFEYYSQFSWIWLDILTLANGLFFMYVFKNMALR